MLAFHGSFGFFLQETDVCRTGWGGPVDAKDSSQTVGPRGPMLMQDVNYIDAMAHFDRERIPERVVHAKGAGKPFISKDKSFAFCWCAVGENDFCSCFQCTS